MTVAPIDQVFHALGDKNRRQMIEHLTSGPRSVSELAAPFQMSLAAVVQHLRILEQCGLVSTEKAGRVRTCCLNGAGFQAAEAWIQTRKSAWERKFDRLAEILDE